MAGGVLNQPRSRPSTPTDFHSLKASTTDSPRRLQYRTTTDYLIDALTPLMIFMMVSSVIFFLLDVRYVYLEIWTVDRFGQMYEQTLHWVAFFFVMGVVALNRLIAREGKNESVLYIVGLTFAIGLYTFSTTDQIGSVAHNFMNQPYLATLFNMGIVALIWWIASRLTHECCVDENPIAGDIGILTGTARRLHNALSGKSVFTGTKKKEEPYILGTELDAIDPSEWRPPEKKKTPSPDVATKRLPKRHPGISVFYASIPAMVVFAVGQWVLRSGDVDITLRAHIFLAVYTISALSLLMLSSLGGLRQYFQARRIKIPAGIGPFWTGMGSVMILMVAIAASWMPAPGPPPSVRRLEPPAYNQINTAQGDTSQSENTSDAKDHKGDQAAASSNKATPQQGKTPPSKSQAPEPKTTAEALAIRFPNLSRVFRVAEIIVLVCMGLMGLYALVRVLGAIVVSLTGKSGRGFPALARFLKALDRFLQRLTHVPSLPKLRLPRRVRPEVALSTRYVNPLGDPALSRRMTPAEVVEYSYAALCALAHDLAVPRRTDQTPYEFIESFPASLGGLREDAIRLTNLYVVAAYSNLSLEPRHLDIVRGFWRSFEIVRAATIR
jgi:hypothetical protein